MEELWSRALSYIPYGSGGQKYISGWVHLFIPFSGENNLRKLEQDNPEQYFGLDENTPIPEKKSHYDNTKERWFQL